MATVITHFVRGMLIKALIGAKILITERQIIQF